MGCEIAIDIKWIKSEDGFSSTSTTRFAQKVMGKLKILLILLFLSFYKMLIEIGLFLHALWAQRSCLGSTVVPWPFQHVRRIINYFEVFISTNGIFLNIQYYPSQYFLIWKK
jgi:hypothetical protein